MTKGMDYWSLIEPFWLPLNRSWDDGPEAFVRLFGSVPPAIGHLYAAHWCQSEVCNGGLDQFFGNTTGLLAPEALDGFRAMGATIWAAILAEGMEYFGTPYPRNRAKRAEFLRAKHATGDRNPFDRLDQRFFEWASDWEAVADAYANRATQKDNS